MQPGTRKALTGQPRAMAAVTASLVLRERPCANILAALVSAHVAAAGAVPPPVVQYGAECQAPTFATDMLVCADDELRRLDADVQMLFEQRRMESPEESAQLESSQWEWFQRRSKCAQQAAHRQCALDAYAERLATLRGLHGGDR